MKSRRKNKTSFAKGRVAIGVCSAVLWLGPFFPVLWMAYPLCIFYLSRKNFLLALISAVASFALTISLPLFLSTGFSFLVPTELDLFGLILLLSFGFCLSELHQAKFYERILSVFLIAAIGAAALFFWHFFQDQSLAWIEREWGGTFLPPANSAEVWGAENRGLFEKFVKPFLDYSLVSWFAFSFSIVVLFNGMLSKLVALPMGPKPSRRLDFWSKFSAWKAPDLTLIPLAGSLLLAIIFTDQLFSTDFSWLAWATWNLLAISLFPLFLGGLSIFSYVFPRLPSLIFLIVLFIVLFQPLVILVGAGLADLCFDFRKRFKDLSRKMKDDQSNDLF